MKRSSVTLLASVRPRWLIVGNMVARSAEGAEQDEANRGKGTQHLKLVG
jgi:hypothetical protein